MKAVIYSHGMLSKEDKKWALETVNSVVNTAVTAATNSTVTLLSAQIEGLARMTARGFEACASKEELWAVEDRLEAVEGHLSGVEGRLTSVENHLGSLDSRLQHLEDIVVTKDYLDERLGIIKGKDFEIHKQLKMNSVTIVAELRRKKIIGPKRANTILAMQPFPQKLS